ncbi:hypothetical protein [Pseudonocardia sp. HH130630-07]|uniref:hypothetical protein n=1 Tax=Pseudonocardia sp. HH130630-07 TaxID=1690815 RepID=UPI0012EA806E|nr:hypothetical protein [Pseudonocardia sp. HH130630-07]
MTGGPSDVVLDTSVLVMALLGGEDGAAVRDRLRRADTHAPPLPTHGARARPHEAVAP